MRISDGRREFLWYFVLHYFRFFFHCFATMYTNFVIVLSFLHVQTCCRHNNKYNKIKSTPCIWNFTPRFVLNEKLCWQINLHRSYVCLPDGGWRGLFVWHLYDRKSSEMSSAYNRGGIVLPNFVAGKLLTVKPSSVPTMGVCAWDRKLPKSMGIKSIKFYCLNWTTHSIADIRIPLIV